MSDNIKEPIVEQPSQEIQQLYKSLVKDCPTKVHILGTKKTYNIHWLKYSQLDKLSNLLINKDKTDNEDKHFKSPYEKIVSDSKLACKAAAIYILNGFFSLHLKYWFLWRWFYYIKQYSHEQLQELLSEGKKKVPQMQFYATTMLLIGARDTLLQMTTKEAELILQGLSSEQLSQTRNTESSSSGQDISSSD